MADNSSESIWDALVKKAGGSSSMGDPDFDLRKKYGISTKDTSSQDPDFDLRKKYGITSKGSSQDPGFTMNLRTQPKQDETKTPAPINYIPSGN